MDILCYQRNTFHVKTPAFGCFYAYNMHMSVDSKRKEVGRLGEEMAAQFLKKKGFKILERNYRRQWGEIDIIAEKGDSVRFVEVKAVSRESMANDVSRETSGYRPEERVNPSKLRKVARTAESYMAERGDERDFQIDVVGVFLDLKTRRARCRLFEQVL